MLRRVTNRESALVAIVRFAPNRDTMSFRRKLEKKKEKETSSIFTRKDEKTNRGCLGGRVGGRDRREINASELSDMYVIIFDCGLKRNIYTEPKLRRLEYRIRWRCITGYIGVPIALRGALLLYSYVLTLRVVTRDRTYRAQERRIFVTTSVTSVPFFRTF